MANLAGIATFGLHFVAKEQVSATLQGIATKYKWLNRITGNAISELGSQVAESGTKQKIALAAAGNMAQAYSQMINQASAAAISAFKGIIKEAADFEQEMAMFSVITGQTGAELEALKLKIIEVTGPLPTTANQVAKAATAFAKMGLAAETSAENLILLSHQAIMFGRAIRVSDEQAAMFMGKLATWLAVTDKSADSMGRLASVVTKLGWNIKGTAQDVVRATERFGAFVRAMGATEVETLALAALVQDSGILIRRGSTAINRTFQLMSINARQFGMAMQKAGEVGSAAEFETMFRTSPVKAFETVLRALSKQGGAYGAVMLKNLGLHGNYISDLITMSRNVGKLNQLIGVGNQEFSKSGKEVSATEQAFNAYSQTLNASIEIIKGAWTNLKILMGAPLLGVLSEILQAISGFMTVLMSTAPGRAMLYLAGGLIAVAAGGLLVLKIYKDMQLMFITLEAIGSKTMLMWTVRMLKFIAIVLIAVAVITLLLWAWNKLYGKKPKTLTESFSDVTGGIKSYSSAVLGSVGGGETQAASGETALAGIGGGGGAGGMGMNTPEFEMPAMASGGIVVQPTPVVVGDKGPEAVLPLKKFDDMMYKFSNRIGEMIAGAMSNLPVPKIEMSIPLTIDGKEVGKAIAESADTEKARTGEVEGLRKGEAS